MPSLIALTPSIDQLSRIIGSVAAPAFLLGAVAAFMSLVNTRIDRILDRSRYLHEVPENDPTRAMLRADIPRLKRRAALLSKALYNATICAIITAALIVVAFASAMLRLAHEYGVALLFMAALVFFTLSLIDLARETRIAVRDYDHLR
jgi:hypothetical protein